ncbi:3-oxoacyl-ACP reductase [Promicromonospora thailandica]|uniref:3-oxoacyl-[acyl-carrier protein] reductase n=1 Tax=Promicromonospora thailandica TaxID=765201 RepID=A0A9X2JWT4_9MICO|nr:3-oxoacyl-ACP reductase [Promicromonospora thailandica]MCP2263434.1 3-oxoacyl-[acyl-carrier protein] reductase [Promicromonospora thailandica]BFF19401.1 3-oxoacyl-ACP reductase [Promicromonospora thailandica]
MTDSYLNLANGTLKPVFKKLGLPQPAILRRYRPGGPLTVGPVLVVSDDASAADADAVAKTLAGWDVDVRRTPEAADGERFGAVVLVLTGAQTPDAISAPVLTVAGTLRRLAGNGRVVAISRAVADGDAPVLAATRGGVEGLVRSLGKELRGGSTANGIQLTGDAAVDSASALATLRFFLSAKSAYVDGQLLPVGPAESSGPVDWERPLAGKVGVVTGAARGIGAAIARTMARDGAKVVVIDVPPAGEALAAVANEIGGVALQLDITADDAADKILAASKPLGGLDVLVHNAGITRDKLLANMTADKWDPVIAVNLTAQLRINERLLAAGVEGLRIVSLASTTGLAGNRGQTNYGYTKAGVIANAAAGAPVLAAVGGTTNAVAPGWIETEMTAKVPALTRTVARRMPSLGQGGLPVDIAEAICFLASDPAAGINGQTLRVCGQHMVGK